jgi:hypothetical protein
MLSISQLVDAELEVLFHKSNSQVLDSSGKRWQMCVSSFALEMFFKLIFLLLSLP